MRWIAITALAASACISIPGPTGVAATGEPLRVSGQAIVEERVHLEPVTTATTPGGERAQIYRVRHVSNYLGMDWSLYQGEQVIDDEDFFRIAGDHEALAAVNAHRRTVWWVNRSAVVGLVLGGVANLAGSVMLSDQDGSRGGGLLLVSGVLLTVGGGYGVIWSAYQMDSSRHHGVPVGTAVDAANRYNQQLRGP